MHANRHRRTREFRPTSNPEQAHWMRELGKSSAAQPHTLRRYKGTRTAQKRGAIADQRGG